MSELAQGQDQPINIQQEQAIAHYERWVNESIQADIAYANGTLEQWLKTKLERELNELNKGQQSNGQSTNT